MSVGGHQTAYSIGGILTSQETLVHFFAIISTDNRTINCGVVEPVIFSQRVVTTELFTRRHFDFSVKYLAIVHFYSHEASTIEQ